MGRPSQYTPETGDFICDLISKGNSLSKVCNDNPQLPEMQNIFGWISKYPDFREKYARAVSERSELGHEELERTIAQMEQEIASNADDPKLCNALVQMYRVKIDTIKWTLARQNPKKYGDKLDITSDNEKITVPPILSVKVAKE